jgi:hypothetical protein
MRQLVLVAALVLGGCTAQGLPIDNPSGAGGNGSGGGGGSTSGSRDMAHAGAGEGGKCMTACDCQAGLACRMGTCGQSPIGMIFCCDSTDCPTGNICQSSGGGFSQCGGGGNGGGGNGGFGGGPGGGNGGTGGSGGGPGGIPDFGFSCSQIPCGASANICAIAGCGKCSAAGTCSN